jgi:hypothetical protein
MKVNCLGCGYKVDLADAYDDYEGPIKCFACGAIMEIATQEGSIRGVGFATGAPLASAAVGGQRRDMGKRKPVS